MGSPLMAFTFGRGGLLIFPTWAGASVYFPDIPCTPKAMAQLIFATGATICYTAPTFYRQMAPFMQLDGIGATEMLHIFISSPPDPVRRGEVGQPATRSRGRSIAK